jgi:hypothetical protein
MRGAVIMQDKDGHLARIRSKAITWTRAGRLGTMTFVHGQGRGVGDGHRQLPGRVDASRGHRHRAAWRAGGVTGYCKTLIIAVQ